MIEEIKNESEIVLFDSTFGESNCEFEYEEEVIRLKYLFEILSNQPDYKKAWEELKGIHILDTKHLKPVMQGLEDKHKIGGE